MYQCIKKYCENDEKNGLFLMNMPTGFGKTYSVLKYIREAVLSDDKSDKKYIFITTLKKNLPVSELEDSFKHAGKPEVFKDKFLFIDSNADSAINNFNEKIEKNIPDCIKKEEVYKQFSSALKFLQDKKKTEYTKAIRDSFCSKLEPEFRKMISAKLTKEFPNTEKKIEAILTDGEWQWLADLYPSVLARRKKILFMSVDKFLLPVDTIVERPYVFYNGTHLNNCILFIDEIDATKDTMLKRIIEAGISDKINFIELFSIIHSSLNTHQIHTDLITPSQQRLNSEYKDKSLQSVVDRLKKRADGVYKTYNLRYNHKTDEPEDDKPRNFLFNDHQYHSILNDDNKYITIKTNHKQKENTIHFTKNKPTDEKSTIQMMLGKLRGFIVWFSVTVNILAINYMQLRNERLKDGEDEFTLEAAIYTVLSEFGIKEGNRSYQEYIKNLALSRTHSKNSKINSSEYDLSFYENGMRYYSFEDKREHDKESSIIMVAFQNTPEKLLLRMCEKAKVIGISATATIPSVIGNFDIEYLKSRMGDAFHTMDNYDIERLKAEFEEQQNGYEKINIVTNVISSEKYSLEEWENVIGNKELSQYVFNLIQQELPDNLDASDYCKKRYLRISKAYKEFVTRTDIKSFLCIMNAYPKENDMRFNKRTMIEIFKCISSIYSANFELSTIQILKGAGDEFDLKKETILHLLSSGKRLFVISVYQSIGAGQNLQYGIPEYLRERLIHTGTYKERDEKDFDAIYLDNPTNLLVNISRDEIEENEFAMSVFQNEFLMQNAELSRNEALSAIKNAFKAYMTGHKQRAGNGYDTRSMVLFKTQKIIQCIGRICRTNMKNKNIYLFADAGIADSIDYSLCDDRIFNREYIEFANTLEKFRTKTPMESNLEYAAELTSTKSNKWIQKFVSDDWDETTMKHWRHFREITITNPTVSEEKRNEDYAIRNFYIELPEEGNVVYFNQEEDYNQVKVSFIPDKKTPFIESADSCNLTRIMKYSKLKELFESKGYATSFKPARYIMAPPVWNNIYKGVLGEECGFNLFKWAGIELEEIEDAETFELFDFKVKGEDIFVDFKNWQESTAFDNEQILEKIADKADKCNAGLVIVANIIAGNNSCSVIPSLTKWNGVTILKCPCLLVDAENNVTENEKAWSEIVRCINEFKN